MSRKWLAATLAAAIGFSAAAQAQERVDSRKVNRELAVMERLLRTTIEFVTEELAKEELKTDRVKFHVSDSIRSFYLYDQGAVFYLSMPSIRTSGSGSSVDLYQIWTRDRQAPRTLRTQRVEESLDRRDPRVRLRELQERVKQDRTQIDSALAAYQDRMESMKDYLIETVANHGDSLTTVKDGEYINLVLNPGSNTWLPVVPSSAVTYVSSAPSGSSLRQILSLRKSDIGEFKTGKITMADLKQKVRSY